MKFATLIAVVLIISGCGPWVKTDGLYKSESLQCSVELPQGWMRRNIDTAIAITRDGSELQYLSITRRNVANEKPFTYTKRRLSADMLPHELAESVIDDFQSDSHNPLESVEANTPATIAGRPGFMVRLSYATQAPLTYRCQINGLLAAPWYYQLTYCAPSRHYFERDLPTMQRVVQSFALTDGTEAKR